jgi:hypothetical protein
LLVQFSSQSDAAFDVCKKIYGDGQQGKDGEELLAALGLVVKALPQAYIVMDALDECPELAKWLEVFKEMASWKLDHLRVLVTSRSLTKIEEALTPLGARSIALQSKLVDADIGKYVRNTIRNEEAFHWEAEVQEEIEKRLAEGSCGMYRAESFAAFLAPYFSVISSPTRIFLLTCMYCGA